MTLRWYTVVVDSHDIAAQSRWWAETLGYVVVWDSPEGVAIVPPWASTAPLEDPEEWRRQPQGMVFVPVEEGKEVKNRLHLDLAPHSTGDRDAEIEALLGRGATRADVGQPADAGFTVLRDPEGNEFCVLGARSL